MGVSIPYFSVVIPTRNRPELLARAVDSVMLAGRKDLEIVIVNDGSSVSYQDFQQRYGSCVRYYANDAPSGVASARNAAVALAEGQWLVFLDDDDELASGYLDRIEAAAVKDQDCCAVWSGVEIRRKSGDCVKVEQRTFSDRYVERRYLVNDFLSISLGFGFAMNKEVFERIGGFDEQFDVAEDTELFVRLVSNDYIPTPIPGVGIIKHEEHDDRLSADFECYSRNNVYKKLLDKNEPDFLEKWKYSYIQLLMWSYRLHRRYGRRDFQADHLARLVDLGVPEQSIEACYLSGADLSAEYAD